MKKRIEIIDALRGLAVILMVIHHFLFDLVAFLGLPEWLFSNLVFNLLHYFFAGLFIFLSGISSDFSRSNVRRGIKTLAVALLITLVTWLVGMPDLFGILHLLGLCMIFYGLTRRFWDRLDRRIMPFVYILLTAVTAYVTSTVIVSSHWLWPFGLIYEGFASSDYFPIFPWIFIFLLGTWAGKYIVERKLPDWFYETHIPFFPRVGTKALLIHVLHQPVLLGLTYLISLLMGKPISLF